MPELKRFQYSPLLGWSSSRYDVFSICKRRYYYNYYAKYDQSTPLRVINQFKELVSIPLETGAIVHDVIRVLLSRLKKATGELDRTKFFDFAYRMTEGRLQITKFQELAYGDRAAVDLGDLYPKVQESLENLLASERYDWIANVALASSGEWIIDPPGYGESRLDDLKVYCKVDFLFPVGGRYHIIDWKTGKPDFDRHRKQLMGYSAWATYHFDADPENVSPTVAYLHPEYQEVNETFNGFDLESFQIQVRAETQEMYEYCRDRNQNVPLAIKDFWMKDDPRVCISCNFRGICHPNEYRVTF